jgi:hypothetical protein
MVIFDRRSVLAGSGALLAGCSRPISAVSGIVGGSPPLPIPPLLDASEHGDAISLAVQAGETAFYPG